MNSTALLIVLTLANNFLFSINLVLSGKKASLECEARRLPKKIWSKAEVAAVMRHFGDHITKGKLASKPECRQCQQAEDPVLSQRTVQNIRDFVRNRITTNKRQAQRKL